MRTLVVLATCSPLLVVASSGCELMVQLDRSAVDAGEAGCNICSDGNFGEGSAEDDDAAGDTGGDATKDGAASTDASSDATASDGAETSASDAPAGG